MRRKLLEQLRDRGPMFGVRTRAADMIEWLIEERQRLIEENKALRLQIADAADHHKLPHERDVQ